MTRSPWLFSAGLVHVLAFSLHDPQDDRAAARLRSVVQRYDRLLGRAKDVELLFAHPTSLRERAAQSEATLIARRRGAQDALDALEAGAPLQQAHRVVWALADLEWLLRELRMLRRARVEGYRKAEPKDPLPEPLEPLRADYTALKPARRLQRALEVVSIRHGVQGLREHLFGTSAARLRVCAREEVSPGRPQVAQAFGRPVAVFEVQGELRAIEDVCPHRGAPLSQGEISGCAVICPLHAWTFDLSTGRMQGNDNVAVQTLKVQEEEGQVYVLRPGNP